MQIDLPVQAPGEIDDRAGEVSIASLTGLSEQLTGLKQSRDRVVDIVEEQPLHGRHALILADIIQYQKDVSLPLDRHGCGVGPEIKLH